MFGVDQLLIARGIENTAAEGQAASYSRLMNSEDGLLCYAAPSPGLEQPSAGYTFAWTGLLAGANAFGGVIQRGRDDFAHSDYIELRMAFVHKLVAPELGIYLIDMVT
jgi:hypothetical protein